MFLDFLAVEDLICHSFLYVQDLAAERKNCLEFPVAALFGGTAGRVTFNKIDLAK